MSMNVFGFQREVTGIWRKLYNEELHKLYLSPNLLGLSNERGRDVQDPWHV
jgi:hypothetical protein